MLNFDAFEHFRTISFGQVRGAFDTGYVCIPGNAVQEQIDVIAKTVFKNPFWAILAGECAGTEMNDLGALAFQDFCHFDHVISWTLASEHTHQFGFCMSGKALCVAF